MNIREPLPHELPIAGSNWHRSAPPLSNGAIMCIYRGVQSNVRLLAGQFLRPKDVGAGGIMSRDPAAAWDTVYNHSDHALVDFGPQEGGVACVHISASIWNELVQSRHLCERVYGGWHPYPIPGSSEMRVNTHDAAGLINRQRVTIELVSTHRP